MADRSARVGEDGTGRLVTPPNVSGGNAAWIDSAEGVYRTSRIATIQHDCLPIRAADGSPVANAWIDLSKLSAAARDKAIANEIARDPES